MNAPERLHPALIRLVDRIAQAHVHGERLSIRGGGSKAFYGEWPTGEPLSMRELDGIVSHEPSELVVTARAATPLAELEAALARHGQCLPFDPPHFGDGTARATVGGMVAAGLSGPGRANAGAVRDFVLGLSLVNGRGQLLQFGGQVMKNVAGYDVSRLLAGSLGALGVITEVSLKVLPSPVSHATLVFDLPQQAALDALNRWGGLPLPLRASVWFDGRLYLQLAGACAAVDAAGPALARRHGGRMVDPQAAHAIWTDCREQRLPGFMPTAQQGLWRLSVPQTAPAVTWQDADGASLGEPLIEWHGALRWLRAPLSAAIALRRQAQSLGGHATLFRRPQNGLTVPKSVPVPVSIFQPLDPVQARIQQRLLEAFDPQSVFGGGRLSAGPSAPMDAAD